MLRRLLNALLVALGFRAGAASGRAEQRAADVAADNFVTQEIVHAREAGPDSVDDGVRLLRDKSRRV